MKKKISLLLLIPIYIIMFVLNNCREIFSNYKNGFSLFKDMQFINISFIIALFAFFVLIIFSKEKILKNKTFWSSLFVVLCLNLLNGIFIGKNFDHYIVLYFFLIFESFTMSKIIKQRFNISIFVITMSIVIFMTIIALFNLLFIAKYCIVILFVISLIYLLYDYLKNNGEKIESVNNRNLGIVIFSVMFVIFVIGGINRYVHVYDEYSHWAFDAKAVIEYDKLSTCEEVMSPTRTYPPALSVWHYFVNIFTTSSNESHLYIGLSIFILIALMPCFSFIEKKNKILTPILVIAVYYSCYLFGNVYNYTSLYADYALSAVFASGIIFTLIFKDDVKKMKRYLLLSLGMCCIIKPSGIVLAGSFIIIKMLAEILCNSDQNSNLKERVKDTIKKWWKVGVVLLLIFFVWNLYTKICNNIYNNYYEYTLLPPSLETSVPAKLNTYTLEKTIYNLIGSFKDDIFYGILNINLYQYLLIMISFGILIIYLSKKRENKNLKLIVAYSIGYLIFFALTFGSMFVMFTKYEAENLASFGRYLNPFHYAILIVFIVTLFRNFDLNIAKKKSVFITLALFFLIANISFSNILYFVYDYGTDRKQTYTVSNQRNDKFEIVRKNTDKNSQVYVLDQEDKDGIMAMWYARYYSFPRRVNASSRVIGWKIRTKNNVDDLQDWGLRAGDLEKQLFDYKFDYLFLYTYDEEMFKEINYMLDEPYNNVINKYTLFKVTRNEENQTVTLSPVA